MFMRIIYVHIRVIRISEFDEFILLPVFQSYWKIYDLSV